MRDERDCFIMSEGYFYKKKKIASPRYGKAQFLLCALPEILIDFFFRRICPWCIRSSMLSIMTSFSSMKVNKSSEK